MPFMGRADEMRRFNRIPTPAKTASLTPTGFEKMEKITPIDPARLTEAVRALFASWNSTDLENILSDDYYDKSRFGDSMNDTSKVPRDAKLRLLAIQRMHTLQQMIGDDPEFGRVLVSIVLVTARTQLEFNDQVEGFVRFEGVNDYYLEVKEKVE
jgi:hypothetical protein